MRKVKLASIARLFGQEINNSFAISGIIVIVLSVILLILLSAISNWIQSPHNNNDIKSINEKGIRTEARITDIKIFEQIRINGKSPKVITYHYTILDEFRSEQFLTLDNFELGIGEGVGIVVFENHSIIEDVQPFIIPIRILFYIPYLYLVLGVAFVVIGVMPFFNKYYLYRKGKVKDAAIISIYPQPFFDLEECVWVNYTYKGRDEKVFYGKSKTDKKNLPTKTNGKTAVFVSSKNEENSCLIPKGEALINNWKFY